MTWDYAVVGGGTAGCVVASRLVRAGRSVVVLEAGAADRPDPDASGPVLRGHNWQHWAEVRHGGTGLAARYPYFVGKTLGGSSAINGAIALHPWRADVDRWAELGNDEWTWSSLEPRLEPAKPAGLPLGVAEQAFLDACGEVGLPLLDDLNAGLPGAGLVPTSSVKGERVSTAVSHLDAVSGDPRLCVRTGVTVDRVVVRDGSAVGVEVAGELVRARNVVLSAGAIGTPRLLFRSGIGPAQACADAGIPLVADLPGVGANLIDHPVVVLWAVPKPGVAVRGRPWHQVLARTGELGFFLLNNVDTERLPLLGDVLGAPLVTGLSVMLLRPRSRGRVVLDGADGVVRLGLCSDPEDVRLLSDGVRTAWSILRAGLGEQLDRMLMWSPVLIEDDVLLPAAVKSFVSPSLHAAGTARMGTDRMAVVDQYCRVHGVSDLRVVDASVLPELPSAPPGPACVALAERVSDWIEEQDHEHA